MSDGSFEKYWLHGANAQKMVAGTLHQYNTKVLNTYGKSQMENGDLEDNIVSTCMWNKTWTPSTLEPCVANSCPIIPFPPKFTGLLFESDKDSSFSVVSKYSKYSPKLPTELPIPADFCTKEGAMAVGKILSEKTKSSADFLVVLSPKYDGHQPKTRHSEY